MRIANTMNEGTFFYAGKCKGNTAPKHVEAVGERAKVKLDGKSGTMFDSPKSDYIYLKVGENWLWIKDKAIFSQTDLKTMPVTRVAKPEGETTEPQQGTEEPTIQ
jgi:hypothetical protein